MDRATKGTMLAAALKLTRNTSNDTLFGWDKGTISLNPGSIAATTRGTVTFTLTGAAVGDMILMEPPDGLEDDLLFVGARITAADTVTVYLYNPTGAAIDGAALTWDYLWFDFTV